MTSLRLFTVLFSGLVVLAIIWVRAAQSEEMDMMEGADVELSSGDGFNLGCGDCGTKCKFMCGSRRFRLCCLQYMKKRSGNVKRHFIPETAKYNPSSDASPDRETILGLIPPLNLIAYQGARKVYGDEY